MPKKDPILLALWKCPEKCDEFLLKTYGLPQVPSTRKEIQQDCIRVIDPRSKRPTAVSLDEAGAHWGSETQRTDELQSLHLESGDNATVKLSPAWLRYLEYMDVIAEALSPKDKGAALKQLALADARSRYWDAPPDVVPSSVGTPAEFRQRWQWGEIEIRARAVNRREHVIEIWQHSIPPDEPEDLDEAGEPSGHWDGLKWTPKPKEIGGS